jgi:hypothetical protein
MRFSRKPTAPTLRLAMVLAAASALSTGCSDNQDSGPLTLAGYGNVLDGQERPPYFVIDVCAEDDNPSDIKITDVSAAGVRGTREPLDFRVAWADGPDFTRVISARQPVPQAYVEAVGAEGTVSECSDPRGYAALAIALPPLHGRPISLDGIEVAYEIDGDHFRATTDAFLAQCPDGTHARTGGNSEERPLCRDDSAGP